MFILWLSFSQDQEASLVALRSSEACLPQLQAKIPGVYHALVDWTLDLAQLVSSALLTTQIQMSKAKYGQGLKVKNDLLIIKMYKNHLLLEPNHGSILFKIDLFIFESKS